MRAREMTVKLGLPFGLGEMSGVWEPDEAERAAAWELYIELITRTAAAGPVGSPGLLRESLTSLHALFAITREILRRHGPGVATPGQRGDLSLASIAVTILNGALRPLLSRWHPELAAYEARREPSTSPLEHELEWELRPRARADLADVQDALREWADLLAEVAGVPPVRTEQP
jgi:hypothetical protein